MGKIKIIAEAGVNHNGSIDRAHQLIDKATECKATAIKFQTFKTKNLISSSAPLATHHKKNIKERISHEDLISRLEIPFEAFDELKKHCEKNQIEFLSTPYDIESANYLINLGVNDIKIASSELTNFPLLEVLAKSKKNLILSTGMSSFEEITDSINFIQNFNKSLTVLKCTSNYPSAFKDTNILGLEKIKNKFPTIKIGFSDHCVGPEASILAVAFGVDLIEKHFTLNKNDWGPDHKASLDFEQFKQFVTNIRNAELALGDKNWELSKEELEQKKVMQKGTYAKKNIKKGEIITIEHVDFLRPIGSISPKDFYINYKNKVVYENIKIGQEIKKKYFEKREN